MDASIPSLPGTYALIFHALAPVCAQAGALGTLRFEPGWYIYVGSAFGPGGLRGRLAHHLHPRPQRWHVDALKAVAPVHAIWFTTHPEKLEHRWAQVWMGLPGVQVPWDGFGASDCRCRAHLFFSPREPLQSVFEEISCVKITSCFPS